MTNRFDRTLLLFLCVLCAATCVSLLVVVFKQMEVAEALAEVRSVDRHISCKTLSMHNTPLPQACRKFDLVEPPRTK